MEASGRKRYVHPNLSPEAIASVGLINVPAVCGLLICLFSQYCLQDSTISVYRFSILCRDARDRNI